MPDLLYPQEVPPTLPKGTILPNEVIFRDPVYLLTKSVAHIPIH